MAEAAKIKLSDVPLCPSFEDYDIAFTGRFVFGFNCFSDGPDVVTPDDPVDALGFTFGREVPGEAVNDQHDSELASWLENLLNPWLAANYSGAELWLESCESMHEFVNLPFSSPKEKEDFINLVRELFVNEGAVEQTAWYV